MAEPTTEEEIRIKQLLDYLDTGDPAYPGRRATAASAIRATAASAIRALIAEAVEGEQTSFTTYIGEKIRLCGNCPQFKGEQGWRISQCNDCALRNPQPLEEKQ